MVKVTRLVLDVLKPHQPNALEFAQALAGSDRGLQVDLVVTEMDDKTETLQVVIEGADLQLEQLQAVIQEQGASLHSIDLVEVHNEPEDS